MNAKEKTPRYTCDKFNNKTMMMKEGSTTVKQVAMTMTTVSPSMSCKVVVMFHSLVPLAPDLVAKACSARTFALDARPWRACSLASLPDISRMLSCFGSVVPPLMPMTYDYGWFYDQDIGSYCSMAPTWTSARVTTKNHR